MARSVGLENHERPAISFFKRDPTQAFNHVPSGYETSVFDGVKVSLIEYSQLAGIGVCPTLYRCLYHTEDVVPNSNNLKI
jgi:hypothetical protein